MEAAAVTSCEVQTKKDENTGDQQEYINVTIVQAYAQPFDETPMKSMLACVPNHGLFAGTANSP